MKDFPVNNFEWIEDASQFNQDFKKKKTVKKESNKGHFLEVEVQYLEKLCELHNDLPFLPERIKVDKVGKVVANLYDKTVIHIINLKQALNHGLVFKKVHKVIKFNENARLKPYIDMNTDLRKKAKNVFERAFKVDE